ncbi:hypothetical protein BKA69DRAFT_1093413 [Paraphysoderma sedebokerense]|nr:hypothetical protein BKA69DRAFT_1093276 [Paraphysoderma sedebokerense]KAI9138208.1 hypothetical protein BKA69DRAFT_1093413 [Paraphysoderma sedebokerense]
MSLEGLSILSAVASNSQTQPPTPNNRTSLDSSSGVSEHITVYGAYDKPIFIGRGPTVDYSLPNKKVSRKHLLIEYINNNDTFALKVLGMNGAYVDGNLVKGDAESLFPIQDGSVIDIRGTTLLFRRPPKPSLASTKETEKNEQKESKGENTKDDKNLESELSEISGSSSPSSGIAQDIVGAATKRKSQRGRTRKVSDVSRTTSPNNPENTEKTSEKATTQSQTQISKRNFDNSDMSPRRKYTRSQGSPKSQSTEISLTDVLIETFCFSSRPTLDINELYNQICSSYPVYRSKPPLEFQSQIQDELKSQPFFHVRPKTPLMKRMTHWSYTAADDPDTERRNRFAQITSSLPVRGARLSEKKYYFKLPQLRRSKVASSGAGANHEGHQNAAGDGGHRRGRKSGGKNKRTVEEYETEDEDALKGETKKKRSHKKRKHHQEKDSDEVAHDDATIETVLCSENLHSKDRGRKLKVAEDVKKVDEGDDVNSPIGKSGAVRRIHDYQMEDENGGRVIEKTIQALDVVQQ